MNACNRPVIIISFLGNLEHINAARLKPGWRYSIQLKNLINRKNVPSISKADMNACEYFLDLVKTSHILAAAMDLLQMTSLEDDPHSPLLPPDFVSQS